MARLSMGRGKPITPEAMAAQWRTLPHTFQLNLNNFEVMAAKTAVSVFRKSFTLKRLNTKGSQPWKPRKRKTKTHPLMYETGSLKRSITWKNIDYSTEGMSGVSIYTDPAAFGGTMRHKGFCFAAVHNIPDEKNKPPTLLRRGHMASMPARQFIGDSTVLDSELKKLAKMIFQGFPK